MTSDIIRVNLDEIVNSERRLYHRKRKYEWFCETFMGRRKVATRKLATRKVATGKVATGLRQSLKIAISGTMAF